jgi:hypothetical protein
MTYKIETTTMGSSITNPSEIFNQSGLSKEKATELFSAACEKFNLDNATETEAGGRGYDYRVEIIAE